MNKFKEKNGRLPTIACMGLAFKPDIDGLRESPAQYISDRLSQLFSLVVVESNILVHQSLYLVDYQKGLPADMCAYLVAHKQVDSSNSKGNDLDFCSLSQ